MKRVFLFIACVFVLAVNVAPAQQAETFARSVPEGAVFYATTHDLDSFWRGIEGSSFWSAFTRLAVWDEVDFSWYSDFREEFVQNVGFEFNTENVMAVFGKEFAVAFYIDASEEMVPPKVEVLCLARMNPPETVENIISKLLARAREEASDEVLITSIEHAGDKINSIRSSEDVSPIELRWAIKEDVLVAGIGNVAPRIEACLDCMAGVGTSLAQDEPFDRLLDLAHQDRGRFLSEFYLDMETFGLLLSQFLQQMPDTGSFSMMVERMSAMTKAVMCTTHVDHGLRIKFAVEPGSGMNEMMALMNQTPPSAGTHMKYVPADALVYYGANSMPPLADVWPEVMKAYEGTGIDIAIADAIEQLELALDLDFEEDVLSLVGHEFAFVLEGLDMEAGPFPFPKLTILLQLRDRAAGQAFIDKLIGLIEEAVPPDSGLMVTELTHQGATLKVIKLPVPFLQMTLTPTIGITENFLFISSGETYAKATLNAAKGGSNLRSASLYRAIGVPERTNALVFLNMDELMKTGRQIVDWVVTMAEMQGTGEETKEQVDSVVLPLLHCLSTIKVFAAYSVVEAEGPTGVYVIRVEDISAQ